MIACEAPNGRYPAMISYYPDKPGRSWMLGSRFIEPVIEPVVVKVRFRNKSTLLEMFDVPVPLMTDRLHKILLDAGVSNLDVYTAKLTDKDNGKIYDGYLAFNIVGVISAADLSKSEFEAPDGPLVSVDFISLTIDENKTGGALMFRLAESVNGIVVHKSIKKAIESAGIDTIKFISPKEWIG